MSDDQAFAYLTGCSSQKNRKLYDIAVEFVETRELPQGLPSAGTENLSSAA